MCICMQAIFYKKYSTKSDVWSLGCVMYEIWSLGHKPFEKDDAMEVIIPIIVLLACMYNYVYLASCLYISHNE